MKEAAGKCARSWSVAWICCFINFLLLGVSRLSGLLYLASISRYGVDRSRASLPFVLCYAVRNVSGPLIGYVGRSVEIRLLVACGCFLSALGAGACFFAEDITTVTVLWGGVHGLGFGLGTILLPQILNQHFEKYISIANGIAFGGECVAGFVLPVIVELFLDSYGTSGTFLILSGLILHGVPAALLLKSPESFSKQSNESRIRNTKAKHQYDSVICNCNEDCYHESDHCLKYNVVNGQQKCFKYPFKNTEELNNVKCQVASGTLIDIKTSPKNYETIKNNSYCPYINDKPYSIISDATKSDLVRRTSQHFSCCHTDYETDIRIGDNTNHDIHFENTVKADNENHSIVSQTIATNLVRISSPHSTYYHCSNSGIHSECPAVGHSRHFRISSQHSVNCPSSHVEDTFVEHPKGGIHCENATIRQSKDDIHCENTTTRQSNEKPDVTKRSSFYAFRVFLDPPFILILLTQSSMIFIFTTIMTVIVDFSRDAGVSGHQEVYVLMCMSVSDMIGRFGLGWVTDLRFMSNIAFSAVCYAGTGILMVALVFLRGFPLTMTVAFFIGLFLGGLLIVGPGIIMDYIEEDKVTMALASRFVLFAPMSLTQSSLIGLFREKLGSYSGLFYILGFNSFLCCVFSLLVPCAARWRTRQTTPNAKT